MRPESHRDPTPAPTCYPAVAVSSIARRLCTMPRRVRSVVEAAVEAVNGLRLRQLVHGEPLPGDAEGRERPVRDPGLLELEARSAQSLDRSAVVGNAVDENRRLTLQVVGEEHQRPAAGNSHAGDDGPERPDPPHELCSKPVDPAANDRVEVARRYVEEVERLEHDQMFTRRPRAEKSAPGRIRTPDQRLRRPPLFR